MLTEAVEWAFKHRNAHKPPFPVEAYLAALDQRIAEFREIEAKLAFKAKPHSDDTTARREQNNAYTTYLPNIYGPAKSS